MKRGRLYRSRHERMIAGVAGGLAEYFEVDVALIRLLWIIAFSMGAGFLAYLVAWFVIPEEPADRLDEPETIDLDPVEESPVGQEERDKRWRFGGLALIVAGVILLCREMIPWPFLRRNFLPLFLIVGGLMILVSGFQKNRKA